MANLGEMQGGIINGVGASNKGVEIRCANFF
jgi:hypothetical protein